MNKKQKIIILFIFLILLFITIIQLFNVYLIVNIQGLPSWVTIESIKNWKYLSILLINTSVFIVISSVIYFYNKFIKKKN
jgi:hypothetical protein